jgi:predicted site-specific integrase-resolvase
MAMSLDDIIARQKTRAAASPLVKLPQIATEYKISIRQLRRWDKSGLMPRRTRRGRWFMYDKQTVAQLMASRRKTPR